VAAGAESSPAPKPAVIAPQPTLRPTQGTLTPADTQIAGTTPPAAPAPPPTPERVVILDQNNNPPQQEPPVVPDALPAPAPAASPEFLGWLAGLWHSIFG